MARWLGENLVGDDFQANLIASVVAAFVIWLLRKLAIQFGVRRIKAPNARYSARKAVTYTSVAMTVIVVGRIWYSGFDSFATFAGLVSAGVAIALKDPVTNLAGWAFIVLRHPFRVGDRVRIGEHTGDVVDIGLFQFSLHEIGAWVAADQPTGRVIHVPNLKVFTTPQTNYNLGLPHIWDEIPVLVTFESDWERAKHLVHEVAHKHAAQAKSSGQGKSAERSESGYFMLDRVMDSSVYTSVEASGVLLTARYTCDPRQRRATSQAVWEDILRAFAKEPNIEFAYPTERRIQQEPLHIEGTAPIPGAVPGAHTAAR
jgi:small-conductance mechanosensitive channel